MKVEMMKTRARTQAKGAHASSFTPVRRGVLQRKCACGGTPGPTGECEACRKKRLQRKARNSYTSTQPSTFNSQLSEVPPIVHEVLRSPGQPLDPETRAFMEPRFGHDFSHVRVHTDAKAAESARSVNAHAYTVGRDVAFAWGKYQPTANEGRGLIAHELTHVIQQEWTGMPPPDLTISAADDVHEVAADRAANSLGDDPESLEPSPTSLSLQRQSAASDGPKKESKENKIYGPFVLPELVITPTRSYSSLTTPGTLQTNVLEKSGARDITFVKVETVEELTQRARVLNQEAEKKFRENLGRAQGTLEDASPGADERAADAQAQETLKQQFGEGWGTFFWWTRGGGQTGKDSPLWGALEAISGFNRAVPIERPGGDKVFRDRLPETYRTESTK